MLVATRNRTSRLRQSFRAITLLTILVASARGDEQGVPDLATAFPLRRAEERLRWAEQMHAKGDLSAAKLEEAREAVRKTH